MPAQVVVVLDDAETAEALAATIRANGPMVAPFTDPLQALDRLEQMPRAELLITCVQFAPGRGNGRSLALMARVKRPRIKLMFVCRPHEEERIGDLGPCLPLPMDVAKVAELATQLLA